MTASVSLTAPDGISLPSTPLTKIPNIDNLYELTITDCHGKLPNTVRLYGKPPAAGQTQQYFTIDWKVEIPPATGSSPLVYELDSDHTLYLTWAKPASLIRANQSIRELRQESLFYHACIQVDGKTMGQASGELSPLQFIKMIYSGFEDRFVAKVIPTEAQEDEYPMYYYADTDNDGLPDETDAAIITNSNAILAQIGQGNGQCSAWADFFYETCKVHTNAIPIALMKIEPLRATEDTFAVRNMIWSHPKTTSSPITHYPYLLGTDFEPNKNIKAVGLPGQGRGDGLNSSSYFGAAAPGEEIQPSDPPKLFNLHNVNLYGGTVFDPSYGTPPITPQNTEQTAFEIYENAYIELFGLKPLNNNNATNHFRDNLISPGTGSEIKSLVIRQ